MRIPINSLLRSGTTVVLCIGLSVCSSEKIAAPAPASVAPQRSQAPAASSGGSNGSFRSAPLKSEVNDCLTSQLIDETGSGNVYTDRRLHLHVPGSEAKADTSAVTFYTYTRTSATTHRITFVATCVIHNNDISYAAAADQLWSTGYLGKRGPGKRRAGGSLERIDGPTVGVESADAEGERADPVNPFDQELKAPTLAATAHGLETVEAYFAARAVKLRVARASGRPFASLGDNCGFALGDDSFYCNGSNCYNVDPQFSDTTYEYDCWGDACGYWNADDYKANWVTMTLQDGTRIRVFQYTNDGGPCFDDTPPAIDNRSSYEGSGAGASSDPPPPQGYAVPDIDDVGPEGTFECSAGYRYEPAPSPLESSLLAAEESNARRLLRGPFVPEPNPLYCNLALTECLRAVSAAEGKLILDFAKANGEWVYTQGRDKGELEPPRNIATKHGDCTDFVWNASLNGLTNPAWPMDWDHKMGTADYRNNWNNPLYLQAHYLMYVGYYGDNVQPGDIVVRGGHAGIYDHKSPDDHIWGYANNGYPAVGSDSGHDGQTGKFDFTPQSGIPTYFFRQLVPTPCPSPFEDIGAQVFVDTKRVTHFRAGR